MEKLDIDISYRNDGSLATDLGSIIELCLPSDEELRKEIEVQKQIFVEQHAKD